MSEQQFLGNININPYIQSGHIDIQTGSQIIGTTQIITTNNWFSNWNTVPFPYYYIKLNGNQIYLNDKSCFIDTVNKTIVFFKITPSFSYKIFKIKDLKIKIQEANLVEFLTKKEIVQEENINTIVTNSQENGVVYTDMNSITYGVGTSVTGTYGTGNYNYCDYNELYNVLNQSYIDNLLTCSISQLEGNMFIDLQSNALFVFKGNKWYEQKIENFEVECDRINSFREILHKRKEQKLLLEKKPKKIEINNAGYVYTPYISFDLNGNNYITSNPSYIGTITNVNTGYAQISGYNQNGRIYNTEHFVSSAQEINPKGSIKSRYGLKQVNPEYYGTIQFGNGNGFC